MIILTPKETALIRTLLDGGSSGGEQENAISFLLVSLRKRGVGGAAADDLINYIQGRGNKSGPSNIAYENLYRKLQTEVSGLRTENQSLANDKKRLEQKITELSTRTSQPYTSPASGSSPRSSRIAQPMSGKVRFDTYQAGYWYATDKNQTQWSIGNAKGRVCLGRKRQYENRFKTIGHYATIAEAVKEMESWIR